MDVYTETKRRPVEVGQHEVAKIRHFKNSPMFEIGSVVSSLLPEFTWIHNWYRSDMNLCRINFELWKISDVGFCSDSTGLSKKMDGIWNSYNLKSTGRIYTFGILKCSEKFTVLDFLSTIQYVHRL
jgi:hypothetical protein